MSGRADERNPYASSEAPALAGGRGESWLFRGVIAVLVLYYLISIITLPFADDFWVGEIPVLALPQIPKSMAFTFIRQTLISLMHVLGWSRGSASPDAIAATPWAFGILFVTPALLVLLLAATFRRVWHHRRWLAVLLLLAFADSVVTLWFEWTSRLSIF